MVIPSLPNVQDQTAGASGPGTPCDKPPACL